MKTILRLAGLSALCVSAGCLAQEPGATEFVLSPAEMDGVTAGGFVAASGNSWAYAQGVVAGAAASSKSGVLSGGVDWNVSWYTATGIAFAGGGTSLVATDANGSTSASGGFSMMRTVSVPNVLSLSTAYGVAVELPAIQSFGNRTNRGKSHGGF